MDNKELDAEKMRRVEDLLRIIGHMEERNLSAKPPQGFTIKGKSMPVRGIGFHNYTLDRPDITGRKGGKLIPPQYFDDIKLTDQEKVETAVVSIITPGEAMKRYMQISEQMRDTFSDPGTWGDKYQITIHTHQEPNPDTLDSRSQFRPTPVDFSFLLPKEDAETFSDYVKEMGSQFLVNFYSQEPNINSLLIDSAKGGSRTLKMSYPTKVILHD